MRNSLFTVLAFLAAVFMKKILRRIFIWNIIEFVDFIGNDVNGRLDAEEVFVMLRVNENGNHRIK